MPFYERPGQHLANLGYGAAAGAVVGLGLSAFHWMRGSSDEDRRAQVTVPQSDPGPGVIPATVMMPLVSLSW